MGESDLISLISTTLAHSPLLCNGCSLISLILYFHKEKKVLILPIFKVRTNFLGRNMIRLYTLTKSKISCFSLRTWPPKAHMRNHTILFLYEMLYLSDFKKYLLSIY